MIVLGKEELSAHRLNFICIPTLNLPIYDKTYYIKAKWYTNIDVALIELKNVNPLIIFDHPGKKDTQLKNILKTKPQSCGEDAVIIRMLQGIDEKMWNVVLNNIFEPEYMNFTFKWDFDNYTSPTLTAHQQRRKHIIERHAEYDAKEKMESYKKK